MGHVSGMSRRLILLVISIWLISALLMTCAVKGGLKGGPEDKTAPSVVYTFPQPDSTGVHHLAYIRFSFSEMMDRNSIAKNLFISPPVAFTRSWDGYDELTIHLHDSLTRDITYVVTLGTGLKDLRGNGLDQAFTLAFATGNRIDRGKIDGRLYGLKNRESYTVMAYRMDSTRANPLFFKDTALYISKTGKQGRFRLSNLKNGLYRILAVADANHNLLADIPREKVALPAKDIFVGADGLSPLLNMRPAVQDTSPPSVFSVRALNRRQLIVKTNRTLFFDSLNQVQIRDSASGKPLSFCQWSRTPGGLSLYTALQDSGRRYIARLSGLHDSLGRAITDSGFIFSASARPFKKMFRIKKLFPADSARAVHPLEEIRIRFSLPLSGDSRKRLKEAFTFLQGRDTVRFRVDSPSPDRVALQPLAPMTGDSTYSLDMDSTLLRDSFGRALRDSATHLVFKVNALENFGSLSGRIATRLSPPFVVEVESLQGRKKIRRKRLNGTDFEFRYLEEGPYRLSAFADSDSNGVFTPGALSAFRFSETFHVNRDTVSIRKRWEKSGIIIPLP